MSLFWIRDGNHIGIARFGFPNSWGEGGGLDFILGDGYSGLATEDIHVVVD